MPSGISYVVERPFKYGGRTLQPGETWHPKGGRFDALIINQAKFVRRVETAVADAERTRRRTKRSKGVNDGI